MLGLRYIKVQPTNYLLQYQGGRIVREGAGLSFFYYGPSTSLVSIPTASTEEPFIFEEITADHQSVTIQGQVTYRVADPKKLATLMNFTLAANGQNYLSDDPQKLPQRLINIVNVHARRRSRTFRFARLSRHRIRWWRRSVRNSRVRRKSRRWAWKSSGSRC